MTALIKIELEEVLTREELGTLLGIAADEQASLETVIAESLRARVKRFRDERSASAARAPAHAPAAA